MRYTTLFALSWESAANGESPISKKGFAYREYSAEDGGLRWSMIGRSGRCKVNSIPVHVTLDVNVGIEDFPNLI